MSYIYSTSVSLFTLNHPPLGPFFFSCSNFIMTSPGQIILTGVVILANPHPVDLQKGSRNVAFNVNLPVKDGKNRVLGLLRYFTPEN
jgi:hypothetical protein